MSLFQLLIVIVLATVITAQRNSAEDIEISLRSVERCRARDNGPGYCLSMSRCRRVRDRFRQFQNLRACSFQTIIPRICCPVTLRTPSNSGQTTPRQPVIVSRPVTPSTRPPPRPNRPPIRPPTRPSTIRYPTRSNNPPSISSARSANTLNYEGCGTNTLPADGSGFVVGGEETRKQAWPWMAGIRTRTFGDNTRFSCGGSLITSRHVLSAAHCFGQGGGNRQPSDYRVVLGSHFRDSGQANFPLEKGVIVATPLAIKVHERYQDNAQENDLAIILLDTDIPVNDYTNTICLPTPSNQVRERGNVIVLGWGDTSHGGESSSTLQQATFGIIPAARCRHLFRNVQLANGITEGMLCAGNETGGVDSCQGDSGGPLVMKTGVNQWTQVGVVAFGYKCAERGFPGVYTKVSNYFPWIRRNVRRMRP